MSVASEKMPVQCPQCGKQLMVPVSAGGKQGRCPQCTHVFTLPAWMAEIEDYSLPDLAPLASDPFAVQNPPGDLQLVPLSSPAYAPLAGMPGAQPQAVNAYMSTAQAPAGAPPNKYNHAFGMEQRAFDAGILGGIALMVLSVVWFVAGLFFDIIFYYPPILFLVGVAALVRGIYRSLMGPSS